MLLPYLMVIIQGLIATHDADPKLGQITVGDDGLISDVVYDLNRFIREPDQIFSDDNLIFAGFGDIHIHAREDDTGKQMYKEEYLTALNAALHGGVVHTAAMPNTPTPLTTLELFKWHRNRIAQLEHPVSLLNYVGIGEGTRPIGKPGEHPYKVYFGKSVGDLTIYNEHGLDAAFKYYKKHNISHHIEYEPFVEMSKDGKTHSDRRPIGAINQGLRLALPLIKSYEIEAKLCHWSTGMSSFDMINEHREDAKKAGLPYTTIEVSPLHLLFDTDMTNLNPSLWLKIQMNPAIQAPEHRMALIEGLREGFIDYLATDHAPHTKEEKYSAFDIFKKEKKFNDWSNMQIANYLAQNDSALFNATCQKNGMSGAPWLDTYANVCVWLMAEHKFKPQDIARVAAYNPGKFTNQFLDNQYEGMDINFGKGFGKIEKGYVGSLTVLNTHKPQTITADSLQTKTHWSPLEGYTFTGGLEAVIIRGKDMTNQYQKAA